MSNLPSTDNKKGLLLGIACYAMWGILPLYWKLLQNVPSLFVLGNRIIWSAIFLFVFCLIKNRKVFISTIKNKSNVLYMLAAGTLIAINWGTFIYAVNNGYLIESSIGYYINPLVNILMGVLFFKEKLNTYEKIAATLAFIGVAYVTVSYGSFPIIALVLAFTFSIYGVIKKKAALPVASALALENILITPLVITYFIGVYINTPEVYINLTTTETILLAVGGLVTAFPLLLFAKAVKLIPYSTAGFLQYIAPTLQLIIAVVVFREKFTPSHWICFGFIWAGLTVFTINVIKKSVKTK